MSVCLCISLYATCKWPYGPLLLINKWNVNENACFSRLVWYSVVNAVNVVLLFHVFHRLYNPEDYEHLAVSPEVKELFQYISRSVYMLCLPAGYVIASLCLSVCLLTLVTLCYPGLTYIYNFWHSGTLALRAERQSARMSEIKNVG